MSQPLEVFHLGRTSRTRRIASLVREVKDLVADAWHSPQPLQSAALGQALRTRVGLAISPELFPDLPAKEARHQLNELCQWLRSFNVEYSIGYSPAQTQQDRGPQGHYLTVEVFA
jgi:hypothetical protein